jgi:hypothetical protein
MGTFVFSTGVRVGDESLIIDWIKLTIDGVMKESIADGGFMDISGLGIRYIERFVWAVFVYFILQIFVE